VTIEEHIVAKTTQKPARTPTRMKPWTETARNSFLTHRHTAHTEPEAVVPVVAAGTLEEEETKKGKKLTVALRRDLEEDASFEELEEETHAAGEHEHPVQEIPPRPEVAGVDQVPFSADAISFGRS